MAVAKNQLRRLGDSFGSPMLKRQDDLFARLTMRGYLVLLTLAILLPILIFSAVLYFSYYRAELSRIETDLRTDARQLALTVDRDLAGLLYTAEALATSDRIVERDYAGFHQQALRVRAIAGVNVLLRDLNGQQLVNTRVEWGAPLPPQPLRGDAEVIASRRSYVSGVIFGPVARQPVFTITVPVTAGDRVTHLLNLSLPLQRLTDLVSENLTPNHRAGIVDQAGNIMARSERFEEMLGKPVIEGFMD